MEAERLNAISNKLADLSRPESSNFGGIFDYDSKAEKLIEVSKQLEDPDIWNDAARAQELGKEEDPRRRRRDAQEIDQGLADCRDLFELASMEDDEDTMQAVKADTAALEGRVGEPEFRRMFNNPMDGNACFIEIQSGAGGTEAQDWAGMLERMYLRGMRAQGSSGRAARRIRRRSGRHQERHHQGRRRVRLRLPAHRDRHPPPRPQEPSTPTPAATPASARCSCSRVDDSIEIEINPADVRTDTYRASGAGGQHINKTDSAVRLTHVPSGIVVQCQNDRSQHRNKDEAWSMLRARLYELELRKRQSEQQKLEDAKSDIGWGHQIRSYVLDQSRIKDLRTSYEVGNTQAVLDGDLDGFIQASLKQGV